MAGVLIVEDDSDVRDWLTQSLVAKPFDADDLRAAVRRALGTGASGA